MASCKLRARRFLEDVKNKIAGRDASKPQRQI